MNFEKALEEKYGYKLSEPATPAGLYVSVVQTGNLVYLSGRTPKKDGKRVFTGVVGRDLSIEQGQEAARCAMVNCLEALKAHLSDLDKIKQFVQVVGFVRSAEAFGEQPTVMNGVSELLLDVFGERGRHTRLALGTSELPGGAAVEVTCIVEV